MRLALDAISVCWSLVFISCHMSLNKGLYKIQSIEQKINRIYQMTAHKT